MFFIISKTVYFILSFPPLTTHYSSLTTHNSPLLPVPDIDMPDVILPRLPLVNLKIE
jgi:hypothetical protein